MAFNWLISCMICPIVSSCICQMAQINLDSHLEIVWKCDEKKRSSTIVRKVMRLHTVYQENGRRDKRTRNGRMNANETWQVQDWERVRRQTGRHGEGWQENPEQKNKRKIIKDMCHSYSNSQCSAQVFKRAGCHLKRAHLARWTDRQKGTISAVNGRKRARSTRWTEQKGHY